jgi:hypothetical protein
MVTRDMSFRSLMLEKIAGQWRRMETAVAKVVARHAGAFDRRQFAGRCRAEYSAREIGGGP